MIACLGDRGGAHAAVAVLGVEPLVGAEHAALRIADVLAEDEELGVLRHRRRLHVEDRLDHRHRLGLAGRLRLCRAHRVVAAARNAVGIGEHVGQRLARRGHRALQRRLDRPVHFGLGRRIDRVELFRRADARFGEQFAGLDKRRLFLGGGQRVLVGVVVVTDARMRPEPVGDRLDEHRALAVADVVDHVLHAVVERRRIVAVEPHALEAQSLGAAVEVRARGVGRDLGVLADLVVLAHEDDRQLPRAREVHRLVHRADRGGAIAEVDDRHAVLAAHLGGEREAVGDRRAGADDRGGQHRARRRDRRCAAMPPLPLLTPSFAAERLGEHRRRASRPWRPGRGCRDRW